MTLPLSRYKVVGHSMLPTLNPGQTVWVFNWAYFFSSPKPGDVVVFKSGGKEFIKRIEKVFKEAVYLKGDNAADSLDSRGFGSVERKDLVGKVIL